MKPAFHIFQTTARELAVIFVIVFVLSAFSCLQSEDKADNPISTAIPDSIVFQWISSGDTLALAEWLEKGGNSDLCDSYNPLIIMAVNRRLNAVVDILISSGCDVSKSGYFGYSALHHAVGKDDTTMIGILLKAGAHTEAIDSADRTPLFLAIDWNRFLAGKYLVEHGADINTPHNTRLSQIQTTPLHYAAEKGLVPFVQILLDAGVDIETTDSENNTPLEIAWKREYAPDVWCGNTYVNETMIQWIGKETFLYLLERGADLSKITSHPDVFIIRGAKYNIPEFIEMAVERGANINMRIESDLGSGEMGYRNPMDKIHGRQLIHLAAKFNAIEPLKILIEHGASITTPDTLGQTPFTIALNWDAEDVIGYLLNAGISPDTKDVNSTPALNCAVGRKNLKIAKMLIENGANIDAADINGLTPLQVAQNVGDTEMVKLLEEAKAAQLQKHR